MVWAHLTTKDLRDETWTGRKLCKTFLVAIFNRKIAASSEVHRCIVHNLIALLTRTKIYRFAFMSSSLQPELDDSRMGCSKCLFVSSPKHSFIATFVA